MNTRSKLILIASVGFAVCGAGISAGSNWHALATPQAIFGMGLAAFGAILSAFGVKPGVQP